MTENPAVSYRVFQEKRPINDVGERVTYGIEAVRAEEQDAALRVGDISTERETVEGLAALCNRGEASPEHFFEILEDFWGSQAL